MAFEQLLRFVKNLKWDILKKDFVLQSVISGFRARLNAKILPYDTSSAILNSIDHLKFFLA